MRSGTLIVEGVEFVLEDALGESLVGLQTPGGGRGASIVGSSEVNAFAIYFDGVVAELHFNKLTISHNPHLTHLIQLSFTYEHRNQTTQSGHLQIHLHG